MRSRMKKVERFRFYKNKGFSEPLCHMFCDMDEKMEEKINEEPTYEMKQYIYQKSLDLDTKKSSLLKLDNIININHNKLNKYFHEDYPNGWGFPDEVYDYIKSFNPPQPKKLKCLYYTDSFKIKNKVRILKRHFFVNRSDRPDRNDYGGWFFSRKHSDILMKKIKDFNDCLKLPFAYTKPMRNQLKIDNDCDRKTLNKYTEKYEGDHRFTNIVDKSYHYNMYDSFFFIHLSYSGKNKLCFHIYNIQNNQITNVGTFNKKYRTDKVYKLNNKQREESGLDNLTSGNEIIITDDLIPMNHYLESIKERPDDIIKQMYSKIKKLQPHKKYFIHN